MHTHLTNVHIKDFYSALFPSWKFKESSVNAEDGHKVHQYMFTKPDGLSGGIVEMPKDCPPHNQSMGAGFTNYYLVNEVDEASASCARKCVCLADSTQAVAKIEKLGGKLVLSKRPEGKNGLYANVVDPEGNRFGVYQWLGGDGSS